MQNPRRSAFTSGQAPLQSFVRSQLRTAGMPSIRQPQPRFTQPSDHYNNSNNMPQQQQTRVLNPGPQYSTQPKSANIP